MASHSYFMAFLGVASGRDLADYRNKYFTGQAVTATGLSPSLAGKLPSAFEASGCDQPPLADPQPFRETMLVGAAVHLDRILPIALRNFRQKFPLLPGETITQETMTALSADWQKFPRGTVVYRRETNLGTIAFGILTMTIDLETGATSYVTPANASAASGDVGGMLQASGGDEAAVTTIEAALTVAQFVGFALPPYGLILSGGAAVLQLIFSKGMSQGQVPLSTQVANAVKAAGVQLNLENIDATIGTDYDWLRNRYEAAWADQPVPISNQDYADFKRHLSDKLAADTGLIHDVNLLNETSYQIPGFPMYLLGASLVLLLMKIDLQIRSTDASIVDTTAYTTLKNALTAYISNAENTKAGIDKQIADRLKRISAVRRDDSCELVYFDAGACSTVCKHAWTYSDGSDEFPFPDTQAGCGSPTVDHKADAERDRTSHYRKVQDAMNRQLYGCDPQKFTDTIQAWKKSLADLTSASRSAGP